jgi:hypothetical protein
MLLLGCWRPGCGAPSARRAAARHAAAGAGSTAAPATWRRCRRRRPRATCRPLAVAVNGVAAKAGSQHPRAEGVRRQRRARVAHAAGRHPRARRATAWAMPSPRCGASSSPPSRPARRAPPRWWTGCWPWRWRPKPRAACCWSRSRWTPWCATACCASCARADEAGVDLGARGIDAPVWVAAEPTLLEGILNNLVDNALRYGVSAATARSR